MDTKLLARLGREEWLASDYTKATARAAQKRVVEAQTKLDAQLRVTTDPKAAALFAALQGEKAYLKLFTEGTHAEVG